MFIPTLLLKKLYTLGSLTNVEHGVRFAIKNRLSNAEVTDLSPRSTAIQFRVTQSPFTWATAGSSRAAPSIRMRRSSFPSGRS
jgi:hypothetical protein